MGSSSRREHAQRSNLDGRIDGAVRWGDGRWYSSSMRRVVIAAALVLLLATGGWWVLGASAPRAVDQARPRDSQPQVEEVAKVAKDGPKPEIAPTAKPKPAKRVVSKQERDAMRRRIADAMQAREGAAPERNGGASAGEGAGEGKADDSAPPNGRLPRPDDEVPTPGNLIDRTGDHGHMVKVLNEDLMPLVDECYALARETQPQLTGMLVMNVDMIGDEEIGGVIESVMVGEGNEIVDPALVECVQESLLSTTLPPPPKGGKEAMQLQMRLEPEEG